MSPYLLYESLFCLHSPYSPVQPRCTASSRLPPVVLSHTNGLRGWSPIGWLTRCGPHRPALSSYSGSGLVGMCARPSKPGSDWRAHFGAPRSDWCSDRGLLLGRLGIGTQLGIGEKGYMLLYSCTHTGDSLFLSPCMEHPFPHRCPFQPSQ